MLLFKFAPPPHPPFHPHLPPLDRLFFYIYPLGICNDAVKNHSCQLRDDEKPGILVNNEPPHQFKTTSGRSRCVRSLIIADIKKEKKK